MSTTESTPTTSPAVGASPTGQSSTEPRPVESGAVESHLVESRLDELVPRLATAPDGGTIEYFSVGHGPGMVVVHGSMQSAGSQSELAGILADRFTVHLINRRGRGRSSAYPPLSAYTSDVDVADVEAVIAATGATGIFGISSGGVIAAQVASRHPALAVALFEPAFVFDGSLDLDGFLPRFDREVAAGDVPGYMVTAMLGAQMGPSLLRLFPRRMLRSSTRKMLVPTSAKPLPSGAAPIAELAAALPYDIAIIRDMVGRIGEFASLSNRTLLISGTKSPKYLRRSVAELARLLPEAEVATVRGVNHSATQNTSDWGKPQSIAPVLREAFEAAGGDESAVSCDQASQLG